MLQLIGQHLWIRFYDWKGKTHHNNKLRHLNTLISMWLSLVSSNIFCWDALCSIARVSKSPTFRSPLIASSSFFPMKFSKWSFSCLLPLCLSHPFSLMHIPHSSCCQNSFVNFLLCMPLLEFSVLETFCQTLPSPASLTAFYRLLCILQQYCHVPSL